MDVRINDVQSRIHIADSERLLDPRLMEQIVRACVRAVKEDLAREQRLARDRNISNSIRPDQE
jgi:hypothetical protein